MFNFQNLTAQLDNMSISSAQVSRLSVVYIIIIICNYTNVYLVNVYFIFAYHAHFFISWVTNFGDICKNSIIHNYELMTCGNFQKQSCQNKIMNFFHTADS